MSELWEVFPWQQMWPKARVVLRSCLALHHSILSVFCFPFHFYPSLPSSCSSLLLFLSFHFHLPFKLFCFIILPYFLLPVPSLLNPSLPFLTISIFPLSLPFILFPACFLSFLNIHWIQVYAHTSLVLNKLHTSCVFCSSFFSLVRFNLFVLCFWILFLDKSSVFQSGWPQPYYLPDLTSQVIELEACAITVMPRLFILKWKENIPELLLTANDKYKPCKPSNQLNGSIYTSATEL